MKKIALSIVILITFCNLACSEETDGKAVLIKGKGELDAGQYAEAIKSLSEAYNRLPVVGDYILLWLSKAHREMGNFTESSSRLKELLKAYPDTPLKKTVLSTEIRNIISSNNIPEDLKIFESYIKDYPEDNETKFLSAQLFKSRGETEKAKKLFRDVYISNGSLFSKVAYNELAPADITVEDLIEKADNSLDRMEFKEAENLLREALLRDDGQRKNDILKKLGPAVLKQKKYKEAAEIYESTGDYYSRARALYMSGEKKAFEIALEKLISIGDKRAGALLIMTACEKRRHSEIEEALNIFKDVKANYPSEAENSLWGIGWTYYRAGEYQKALEAFTELYNAYGSSKYLYWRAQSLEKTGSDAAHIYRQLVEKAPDFYTILARLKTSMKPVSFSESSGQEAGNQKSKINDLKPAVGNPIISSAQNSKAGNFSSTRINLLLELGLKKEAAAELAVMAKKATSPDELMSVSLKLQEAGEYRLPLLLAAKLPGKDAARNVLYPLAHWPIVQEASARYGVDPFVILSVMREESRFDPAARSIAGALGLMQLMPKTAFLIDSKINLNVKSREQIHDIKININLGSYYINSLLKEFGSLPAAVAAYNAGENIVRKWQREGNYKSVDEFIEDIPYEETRNFAKRVITSYFEYFRSAGEYNMLQIL